MAKHAALPSNQRMPLTEGSQALEGKMHARHCTPKHSAFRYSFKERMEQEIRDSLAIAAANARQSIFYQKNDRTEDARG